MKICEDAQTILAVLIPCGIVVSLVAWTIMSCTIVEDKLANERTIHQQLQTKEVSLSKQNNTILLIKECNKLTDARDRYVCLAKEL